MSDALAIELDDLTVVYNHGTPDEVVALSHVSLSVVKGETIVITGSNGSGKSTLLNAIAGTAPVRSGRVLINGIDVSRWPSYRRARMLGFVHQDTMLGTCPNMTLHENCRLAGGKHWWWPLPEKTSRDERQSRLIELCAMPLDRKAGIPLTSLSGGQRQGTSLILALSSQRPILLMDEFTSSLDNQVRESCLKLIAQESVQRHLTILAIVHNNDDAGSLRGRAINLVNGMIQEEQRKTTWVAKSHNGVQ